MLSEVFLKEINFESLEPIYIRDITPDVESAVKKSEVDTGLTLVRSMHTTLGLILNEVNEPKLLKDLVTLSMDTIGEDPRGTWFTELPVSPTKNIRYYEHNCDENTLLPPDLLDKDHNAGRHGRTLAFTDPGIWVPINNNNLVLGTFQRIAIWEHDGRDGNGASGNPKRDRTVQVWIYPFGSIRRILD